MEWIIGAVGVVFGLGVALAVYEYKKKRALLEHDLSLQPNAGAHAHAAQVHAEDVVVHRISGFN